jgi:putative ABC transport system permease protein
MDYGNFPENHLTMISNYFLTAFRNIIRHKGFSVIVVLSLTIGVAVFGLIFQYVNYELSCDHFNKHFKSIYRLEINDWALTGTAYGPEIARQFPEIVSSSRVSSWEGSGVTIKIGDNLMKLESMIYADSGFFNIFSMRFVKGNPVHAIDAPNTIVLTESTAKKIFGNEDPMNKTFIVNNKVTFTVTGVIKDVNRFHLKINAIASFISLKSFYDSPDFLNKYDQWNYYTYFYLKDNVNTAELSKKINAFYVTRIKWVDLQKGFSLRPLKEIYFTHLKWDMPQIKANFTMMRLYMLVAIFILVIACINFINLTIARATTRSREIGIRKVMGGRKGNLVTQFLGESVIYALISTELSLVLMDLLQPLFNSLVQRQLGLSLINWVWIILLVLILPLTIGILAGIYPALYLTRFKPVTTIKNEKTRGKGSLFFRRLLIVGQFTISIVLIIATLTVYKQLTYLQKADLGFSRDNIINIGMNSPLQQHKDVFRQMLLSNAQCKNVAFSTQSMENVSWQESIEVDNQQKQFTYLGIDTEFIPMMGMEMKEGRTFSPDTPSDSGKVIVNEEAVRYFGLKDPAVGQFVGTGTNQFEVLGVVKNFHFNSLRSPIGPLVMMLRPDGLSTANIKVDSKDLPATIKHLQNIWNTICPEFLFEYNFLDKSYEKLYSDEMRLGKQFLFLTLLAIFIAAIGLLGLSSFLAEQRIKEIGIRKAMGDTTTGIIRLFARDFVGWVILSGIIAIPIALYLMNSWLKDFAYRISIDGFILIGSCLIAIIVALFTVMGQTYKIAARNPVEALRYE